MFKQTVFFCLFMSLSYCSQDSTNALIKNIFDNNINIKPVQNIVLDYLKDISDTFVSKEVKSMGLKSLAFLPDGRLVLDKTIESILKTKVSAINIQGLYIAIASEENIRIYLFNGELYDLFRKFEYQANDIARSIVFSPDCKKLASLSENGKVKIWDIKTGDNISPFETSSHGGKRNIMYSPNGKYLASLSTGLIRVWNCETNNTLYDSVIKVNGREISRFVQSFAFSHDSRFIYIAYDSLIERLNLETLSFDDMKIVDNASSIISSVNGKYIFSAAHDGKIKLWDSNSAELKSTLNFSDDAINELFLLLSHDGTNLAAFSRGQGDKMLTFENGTYRSIINPNPAPGKIKVWENLAFAI